MTKCKTNYYAMEPFIEFLISEESAPYRIQPQHKDRLFRFLFQDKASLLSLYNAVSGTHYTDPEQLEINTVDTVLYMKMHNDLSFLIDSRITLYEQQSSWNPNMPLRGLFHFAQLYSAYVETHELDIYSSNRLELPFPQYVVFYIGTEQKRERETLYLSASFQPIKDTAPALECTATVLNIRQGYNKELLEGCRRLYEYSYLISAIQDNISRGMTLTAAADSAAELCIKNNIPKNFLSNKKRR